MRKEQQNFTEGSILRHILVFGAPILMMYVTQRVFDAADLVLTSWLGTSGNDAVAAIGATTALTGMLLNFFNGCSGGSAVAVSHALGRGRGDEIHKTVHTSLLLSVVMGTMLCILGLATSRVLLQAIGTPKNLIPLSAAYLRTYFLGMIPLMVYNFGSAVLRATGESKKPFYFLLISGPVKLLLTVLFISVLKMDVAGLSLATACSHTVSAALVVAALMRRKDFCRLRVKELKFYSKPLKKILRLGIPAGIQSSAFSISGVVIQSSVNSLSHLQGFLAGNAAAVSLEGFADAVTGTLFQIGLTLSGQNYGARRLDRIKKTTRTLSLVTVIFTALFSVGVIGFSGQLLRLYLKGEPSATHWGGIRLLFYFTPFIFQGLMDCISGCIRGMGRSVSVMMITLMGACVFRIIWLLTIFRIPAFHTPQCLYISYPLAWMITYGGELILYRVIFRKAKSEQ